MTDSTAVPGQSPIRKPKKRRGSNNDEHGTDEKNPVDVAFKIIEMPHGDVDCRRVTIIRLVCDDASIVETTLGAEEFSSGSVEIHSIGCDPECEEHMSPFCFVVSTLLERVMHVCMPEYTSTDWSDALVERHPKLAWIATAPFSVVSVEENTFTRIRRKPAPLGPVKADMTFMWIVDPRADCIP